MNANFDLNEWLASDARPSAVYLADSDCVEYVVDDDVCVHERVDSYLTLIFDRYRMSLIGFKIKGFRNAFESVKDRLGLEEKDFVKLADVLEEMANSFGEQHLRTRKESDAYEAAAELAAEHDAMLDGYSIAA